MNCPRSIFFLFAAALACAAPVLADPAEPRRQQDPVEPPRPTGFERRDIEDMDRRIEERRQQWRDEEAARAQARKRRKPAAEPVAAEPGAGLP